MDEKKIKEFVEKIKKEKEIKEEEIVNKVIKEVKKELAEKPIRKTTTTKEINKEELSALYDAYLVSKITGVNPTETKVFKKEKVHFSKDWNTSDFSDWIPTAYSNKVIEEVFPKTVVAQLFPKVNMTQNPYKIPVFNYVRNAWIKSEGTPFNHTVGASGGNVTFNAVTIMTKASLTDELKEDSIIPILPRIKKQIQEGLAFAIEDAIINGQKTVTLDNDVTQADDHRKAWDGLRAFAHDSSRSAKAEVDLSTFNVQNLIKLRSRMGKYGIDTTKLVFITSPEVMYKFLGLEEVLTMKDYGKNATILTGEIGKFFNIPIVISPAIRTDLDSTGVNSSTSSNNTKTELLLVYKDAWDLGIWKDVRFEPYRVPSVGNELYASMRLDFKPEYTGADDITVAAGINMSL